MPKHTILTPKSRFYYHSSPNIPLAFPEIMCNFAAENSAKSKNKTTMEVAINNNIYQKAQSCAHEQGLNLTTVIESFLLRFISKEKTASEQPVPDVVLSLLGAGEPVADDDLNGHEAYYQYLEDKYQ